MPLAHHGLKALCLQHDQESCDESEGEQRLNRTLVADSTHARMLLKNNPFIIFCDKISKFTLFYVPKFKKTMPALPSVNARWKY